jgi:ribonuclease Z
MQRVELAMAWLCFALAFPFGAPAAQGPSRTRVVMLGTGSPPADPARFGPATAVVVDSSVYLFDAGVGVVRRWSAAIDKAFPGRRVGDLRTAFVTHLHSDHTLGLAELIFTTWTLSERGRRLDLYGPRGLGAMTDHILAAYSEDVQIRTGSTGERAGDSPPKVVVHEIDAGVVYHDSLVTVSAFAVHHGSWKYAYGYRIQTPDRDIVISGDAAPPSVIASQCHACDILIHEGGEIRPNRGAYWRAYHTTADELLSVIQQAKPRLLVLYHQARGNNENGLQFLRAGYPGRIVVANDLDVF